MADRFRIATFNLESLDDRPGLLPPLAARIAVLRPQLRRLDADVLCLQEVNAQATDKQAPRRLAALDRLLRETAYARFHRVTSTRPGTDVLAERHNLVILSRFAIRQRRQHWHDLVPPPRYRPVTARPPAAGAEPVRWERPVLWAVLELPDGRPLHVCNLHLKAPLATFLPGQKADGLRWESIGGWAEGFFLAAVKRAGQALEVRLAVDRLFDAEPEALVAVCGDFNAEALEMPLRLVAGDPEDTGNPDLADRSLAPLDRVVAAERRYTVLHHGRREMLDHLVVSPTLLAHYRGGEILNRDLSDEAVAYEPSELPPGSFHAPVVAEFDLPQR
jgi:endonuclease/exonuclease/phosphatase family metal-dependent hydrolase